MYLLCVGCFLSGWLPFVPQVPRHVGPRGRRDAAGGRGKVVRQDHLVEEYRQQPPHRCHVSGQIHHGGVGLRIGLMKRGFAVDILGLCRSP